MNANKIYQLKLVNTNYENNEDYSHPVFDELSLLIDSDDLNYIEVNDNDDIFLNLLDYKVNVIVSLFEKYFKVIKEDITNNIINGTIYPNVDYVMFNRFRMLNTSIDDILDKICENGIECLDRIDKMILKSQRPPKMEVFEYFDFEVILPEEADL
jgi:hypothetical protein